MTKNVTKKVGKYEIGRTIGEDTFAKVKFARFCCKHKKYNMTQAYRSRGNFYLYIMSMGAFSIVFFLYFVIDYCMIKWKMDFKIPFHGVFGIWILHIFMEFTIPSKFFNDFYSIPFFVKPPICMYARIYFESRFSYNFIATCRVSLWIPNICWKCGKSFSASNWSSLCYISDNNRNPNWRIFMVLSEVQDWRLRSLDLHVSVWCGSVLSSFEYNKVCN